MGIKTITANTVDTVVEAADDRAINAAVFGNSDVVLYQDNVFSHTLHDNNIIIDSGLASMQGCIFRIPYGETETLTIDRCSTGFKRRDILCAEYTKSQNVESVKLKIIKGVETIGIAAAPKLTTGDILAGDNKHQMALKEIVHEGTNIKEVKNLFNMSESRILWSGDKQMGENEMVILSEPIEYQRTGIMLIWTPSEESGRGNEENVQHQVISKASVALMPSTTHTVILTNTIFHAMAAKTVTVNRLSVMGNRYNTASGTSAVTGITYNNQDYSLKYIIGY